MSNRKVFQAAPRPKASQANTLDSNLRRIDANASKKTRRKGVREIDVGMGEGSDDRGKEEEKGASLEREDSKGLTIELPEVSPKKEAMTPNTRARLKKADVKGDQLKSPMGLRHRKIPNIFKPKKERQESAEPMTMAEIENQDLDEESPDEEGLDEEGNLTLNARLMGLPGNLEMSADVTSKYFGLEGRAKFHDRVQWMQSQRMKACLEPDDENQPLYFTDKFDAQQSAHTSSAIPFGASRQAERAEFSGSLKDPSAEDLALEIHGGGSSFFKRFKNPAQQAKAGLGFITPNGRLDGYLDNENTMLRMSRLRSGDDPRDEEEADAAFPLRAEARERDMNEAYANMVHAEARHAATDDEAEQRRQEIDMMIQMQGQGGAGAPTEGYDHGKDGSLVLGGDFSLASVGSVGFNDSVDAKGGHSDHHAPMDNDKDERRGGDPDPFDCEEDGESETDRERRVVREMIRRGASGKGRSWKRGYMREHADNLNFDQEEPGTDTDRGDSYQGKGAADQDKDKRKRGRRGSVASAHISGAGAGAGRGLASVMVSKDELARLQRLAANNALVSSVTFEALSLANQELGELPEGVEGGEDGDGTEADEDEDEDEEGSEGEGDAGTGDGGASTSVGEEKGQGPGLGSTVPAEARRKAAGQVSQYRFMQLSMSSDEKQKYYLNRRPSTSYDSPAPTPKSDLALPKRSHYKEEERDKAAVGTGSINEAKILRQRKAKKEERKRVRALEAEVANSGSLSPVHRVRQLRQISSLPRDNSLIHDLQESVRAHRSLHRRREEGEDSDDDDCDSDSEGGGGSKYYQRVSSRRNSASSTSSMSSMSTLNLRMDAMDRGYEQTQPLSPRSKFISNCIRERLNPRAGLLVRKMTTKKLELQNYGMGDQMARILADSIADLPYLQSINIADNRLTDEGMGPIILAAVKIDDLLELNLSKNEIGDVSSDALATYLRNPQCTLQRLVMQTADVDDFEAEPFIDAVKENRSLLELDLTDNLIGGAENLNTVMPDLITGSEAIADLLREGDIKLHTLKLPWNMIRLDGGVDLCSALSINNTLTYLDLSYNSLAQDGGTALGVALEDNTTLTNLIISNNNIDAVACFTICCAVIHNRALQRIVFDGNPIGEQGARALMLVPMYAGGRVEVSAKKCNITMRDPRCWFDFDKPCREYELDMEDGFQRAISMILLLVIACHQSFVFESVNWYPDKESTRNVQEVKLKQALSRERTKHFQQREKIIVSALTKIKDSAADINSAIRLFQEVDEDGSGEIDREEFTEMVRQMGIGMSESRIDEVFNMYDVDGGGSIGLSEFLSFLKTQKAEAAARIDDLCNMPIMTVDDGVAIRDSRDKYYEAWRPPKEGKVMYNVIDGFVEKEIKKTMSSVDQKNIENVINNAGDGGGGQASSMISHAISSAKLRLDEALACCSTMLVDGKDATKIMRMVLPQVSNFEDAQAVVKAITNGDRTAQMKLKREVGDSLRPILGAPNGYYTLDLSDDMDRFCLTRLVEISSTNAKRRKECNAFFPSTQIGDLSQKRNWSSFRNEMFNGEPIEIDMAFASPLPRTGHLQFDFVCGSYIRPRPDDMVLTDSRVVKVLCNSFLLEPTDCVGALKKLKHYFARGESALDCDGHTIFENPTKRAHHIGLHVDDFYDHIHLRKKEYEENVRRENQVVYDASGAAIDDLDEDDYDHDEAHDTSGFSFESSKSLVNCMAIRGIDITKLSRKQRRTMQLGGPGGDGGDLDSVEEEDHDGSETGSLTMSMTSTVEGGISQAEDGASIASNDGDGDGGSVAASVDPQMWKCPTCFTKNVVGDNGDHCTMCDASRPDHIQGHGIGAGFDPATAGEEDAILKKALRKKGNVEGSHKHDPSAVIDDSDPKGLLVKLQADEKVKHKRNEMDQDASESDVEEASSVGHSDTDSTNSDEELDGDEEEDMLYYVKNKIAERKAEEKAKRAEERRKKREERRLAREKKKGLMMSEDRNEDGGGEGDEDEDGDEDANQGEADRKKMMQGLNLLSTKQLEDQHRASEEARAREEYKMKDHEEAEKELNSLDGVEEPRPDAEALQETSSQLAKRMTDAEEYALKMRELLEKKHMHIGLKARRIVEWLEELFGRVWIFSRHLGLILEVFRGAGHKKQTRHFGTYRVEIFVLLFHRVVDMHNLELALKVLSPYEVACVYCRLGWLHLWNPCKPEGAWELNLTRPEERLIAKCLCELATVEPGDNWIEQYFQWQRDSEGMPGWELTTPWLTEDGMPCRGVLTLYYYSGGGKLLRGCSPNVNFRKSLLHLVLIEEQEIVEEGFRDRPPTNLVGSQYVYSNPGRWKQYLGAIVDLTRVR